MEKQPHCAGIIVFWKNKTVLVSTQRGNMSFPKGKRKKGETSIETAWRELEEETGLGKSEVELINEEPIDEITPKGNVSVRYFVGYLKEMPKTLSFDPDELAEVKFYDVEIDFEKLKNNRKEILALAYKKYKSYLATNNHD